MRRKNSRPNERRVNSSDDTPSVDRTYHVFLLLSPAVRRKLSTPQRESELAELGTQQQARLLQDIGELVTQKRLRSTSLRRQSAKSRSKSRNSPHASILAWIARNSSAMYCSTHPRKGGRVLLPSLLARSSRSRRWRPLIIKAAYSMRTSVRITEADRVMASRNNYSCGERRPTSSTDHSCREQ